MTYLTNERQFYVENYPGLIIEKAHIDDLMEYMIKGVNCMKGLLVKDLLVMIKR